MSEKNNRIAEFDFLRICAALMVFVTHIWAFLPFKIPDFGARGVEIFFLLSGFLMFHRYKDRRVEASLPNCLKFGIKKIRPYYFLHIITMLFMVCLHIEQEGFSYVTSNLLALIANITLLQSWIPIQSVYCGANGVSWFLSSILFCYFVFPLFLQKIKEIKNTEKSLAIVCITLIFLAFMQVVYKENANYSHGYVFHFFPVYGLALFFMGMLVGSCFGRISTSEAYRPVNNCFLFVCIGGGTL